MELVVTMGILAILVGITVTVIVHARKNRAQAQCAANLHSIGSAFLQYSGDYNDYYPAPTPNAQWEDLLRPYAARSTFRCAADDDLYNSLSSSYDRRDTGDPKTTLAGIMMTQVTHNDVALSFDALPGWHAPAKIQVLRANLATDMLHVDDFSKDMQRAPTVP